MMNKKWLNRFLVFTVLMLWGFIIYRLGFAWLVRETEISFTDSLDSMSTSSIPLNMEPFGRDTALISLQRDPFEFQKKAKPEPAPVISTTPVKRIPPGINYRLSGVIINSNRKTLVLENLSGNITVYLHENDEYNNLQIQRITRDTVEIKESGVLKIFRLGTK